MDSQFQQYSITFGIKRDKIDIFKTIIRFLDHLTWDYDMGFRIDYANRLHKKNKYF